MDAKPFDLLILPHILHITHKPLALASLFADYYTNKAITSKNCRFNYIIPKLNQCLWSPFYEQ
jgi:hypothetical protein